jgi:hypothetical protein
MSLSRLGGADNVSKDSGNTVGGCSSYAKSVSGFDVNLVMWLSAERSSPSVCVQRK